MKIWLENFAPGTKDEELKELVRKYAPELTCESLTREDGTGSHPGALLELTGGAPGAVKSLSTRLSGMYWKEHELACYEIGLLDRAGPPRESR